MDSNDGCRVLVLRGLLVALNAAEGATTALGEQTALGARRSRLLRERVHVSDAPEPAGACPKCGMTHELQPGRRQDRLKRVNTLLRHTRSGEIRNAWGLCLRDKVSHRVRSARPEICVCLRRARCTETSALARLVLLLRVDRRSHSRGPVLPVGRYAICAHRQQTPIVEKARNETSC